MVVSSEILSHDNRLTNQLEALIHLSEILTLRTLDLQERLKTLEEKTIAFKSQSETALVETQDRLRNLQSLLEQLPDKKEPFDSDLQSTQVDSATSDDQRIDY